MMMIYKLNKNNLLAHSIESVNRRIGESVFSPLLRFSVSPIRKAVNRCLLVLLAMLVIIPAQEAAAQIRAGGAFLKIMPGVRNHGLAGGYTGVLDEMHTIYANPGAAGFLREWQWATSYTSWIADSYHLSGLYGKQIATPWSKKTRFALGLHYQGVGDFNSTANPSFSAVGANDALFSLSVGNPLNFLSRNVSFGTNVKFFRSQLADDAATSWMFDFGLLYKSNRFPIDFLNFRYGILSAGVSANHLGQPLNFVGEDTPLPRSFRAGAAFNLGTHNGLQLQLSADYSKFLDEVDRFSIGTEVFINNLIGLRGGYHLNDNEVSSFAAGISLKFGNSPALPVGKKNSMRVDMAFWQPNTFFNVPIRFGLNHFPEGPEKFNLDSEFAAENRRYKQNEAVELQWEPSQDPDLYDDVNYVLLVSGERQGNALKNLVENTRDDWDLLSVISSQENPDKTLMTLFAKNSPGSEGAVSFKYQGNADTENPSQADTLQWFRLEPITPDSNRMAFTLEPGMLQSAAFAATGNTFHEPGIYSWTVMAYDLDNNVRFAEAVEFFEIDSLEGYSPPVIPPPILTMKDIFDIEINNTVKLNPYRPDINFEHDKDELTADAKAELDILATALKKPDLQRVFIKLGGHTDQSGPAAYNRNLSERRVAAVERYFVEANGIDADRVFAKGYGEKYPLENAYQYSGQKRTQVHHSNRRVEIFLLKQENRDTTNQVIADNLKINAVFGGDVITYNMKITNNGPQAARNFAVMDTIPNFITFLPADTVKMSVKPLSLEREPQVMRWQFAELMPNKSIDIRYSMKVDGNIPSNPYLLINKTSISAENDENLANNIAISDSVFIIGEEAPVMLAGNTNNQNHIVQCGEHLSLLSRVYYGDAGKYDVIYQANRRLIGDDPNMILPGQEIVIPGPVRQVSQDELLSDAQARIIGKQTVGNTLSALYKYEKDGRQIDVPVNAAFTWLRDGKPVGFCRMYTLSEADAGATITVEVTPVPEGGSPSLTRDASVEIPSAPIAEDSDNRMGGSINQSPPKLLDPKIVGANFLNNQLAVVHKGYQDTNGDKKKKVEFLWSHEGSQEIISRDSTYTPALTDVGKILVVKIQVEAESGDCCNEYILKTKMIKVSAGSNEPISRIPR